jgi:hypothetical protein
VLDAFPVVKLATHAVDKARRRVQQQIHGHRRRRNDPLYGISTILRCAAENLTDCQRSRLDRAIAADKRHDEDAWAGCFRRWCACQSRSRWVMGTHVRDTRTQHMPLGERHHRPASSAVAALTAASEAPLDAARRR